MRLSFNSPFLCPDVAKLVTDHLLEFSFVSLPHDYIYSAELNEISFSSLFLCPDVANLVTDHLLEFSFVSLSHDYIYFAELNERIL